MGGGEAGGDLIKLLGSEEVEKKIVKKKTGVEERRAAEEAT